MPSHPSPPGDSFISPEHLLAAIVDSSDDAIISKNLQSVVTSWNAAAERIFGYSAAEMVGQPINVLFPTHRLEEEASIIQRIRKGERVEHFETVRLRRDGTPLIVSITVSPVRNSVGEIIGASKIARDITPQKESQQR